MASCTSLSALPNELLLLIASYCSQDAVVRLSCTNQRLYRLLLPVLYREPRLFFPAHLTAFIQHAIGKHGQLVRHLDLSLLRYRWECMDDSTLITLLDSCPNLTTLNLDSMPIQHEGFRHLAHTVGPRLHSLGLSDSHITDKSLIYLADHCHELRKLDLSLTDITSTGLEAIATGCPLLLWISLRICPGISDASIRALKRGCLSLRHLDLEGCDVNESGISNWDWETDGVYTGDEGTDQLTWDEAEGGRWVVRDQPDPAHGWPSSDEELIEEDQEGWDGGIGLETTLPDLMVPPTMPVHWPVHFPEAQDMAQITAGSDQGSDADWETEDEEV